MYYYENQKIQAREILSSISVPTIEVKVTLDNGAVGKASAPFGASAGEREAAVIVDGDKKRYGGHGALKVVKIVTQKIAPKLVGQTADKQRQLDEIMIKLDGTEGKTNLGGNAMIATSLACARAAAAAYKMPLYAYIRKTFKIKDKKYILPRPMMVVVEGGKHADNSTDFQEYLFSAVNAPSVKEAVRWDVEAYYALKDILHQKGYSTNVGNEGAFAPEGIESNEEPLKMMVAAIREAGYKPGKQIAISLDPAASELYQNGQYILAHEGKKYSPAKMIDYLVGWTKKYPILSLEDGLGENDWENWPILKSRLGKIPLIGDDLTVTNAKWLKKALAMKAISGILIKQNQIGTLTETIDTIQLARQNGLMHVISHRGGGETGDVALVDIAVATNAQFIKVGPTRGERTEKYNYLMEIEDTLAGKY
ncbi:MAG: phosphopyruvate hydratase [Patescibacteria group bacterium]